MEMMTSSTGLDNVRRRSDFSSWDSLIVTSGCLSRDGVWREGRAVTDSIAVSEDSIVPFCLQKLTGHQVLTYGKTHQWSAVSVL